MSKVRVSGKWVLSGEHSVLRGCPAIAFPQEDYFLELDFEESPANQNSNLPQIEECLKVLETEWGIQLSKRKFFIRSSIPRGAGFGSSAALSVALVKGVSKLCNKTLKMEDLLYYSKMLEDQFHGKSSGMDVAVCALQSPICFQKNKTPEKIALSKMPQFSFHDTGFRASTKSCIQKVQELEKKDQKLFLEIDSQMEKASKLAMQALSFSENGDHATSSKNMIESMDLSYDCFMKWGLVPEKIQELRKELILQGASSVRLTGAGMGGFLVAFWA